MVMREQDPFDPVDADLGEVVQHAAITQIDSSAAS